MNVEADRSERHLELTRELWPRLNARSLIPVGDGWTCDTYEVDGQWIVQFPRSAYAEEALRRQMATLPLLARHLPSAIPEPVRPQLPEPAGMLYRRINGDAFTDAPDGLWPEELGRFLRALQTLRPDAIGLSDVSTADLRSERAEKLRTMAQRVLPLVEHGTRQTLATAFARHVDRDDLWGFQPVLAHGDLGPTHILVDGRGRLAGVIDWEELAVGDPAVDFAWLMHEQPDVGGRVLAASALAPDPGWSERTRFLYSLMPFHEVTYGLDTGQQLFVELGLRGIQKRAALL